MLKAKFWLVVAAFGLFAIAGCQTQATPTAAPGASPTRAPAAAAATPTQAQPTATPAPKVKTGGTLRWAVISDNGALYPAGGTGQVAYGGTGRAGSAVYDGLLEYEPETQKLVPALAENWSVSPDGLTLTFNLRKGIKFHDGTAFNAEAVKFHFESITGILDPKKKGRFGGNFVKLKEVQTPDEYTVKLILSAPQASFVSFLGDPSGLIESPTAVNKSGVDYPRRPVGTGPFKVKEWAKDSQLVLDRNEDYWGKDPQGNRYPYLDRIVMNPIPESKTRMVSVRSGQHDFAEEIPPEEVASLKADQNLVYVSVPSFGMETVYLRQDRQPFDKQACREAFWHAIDKKAISQSVYFGLWPAAETILSPASGYYDPNTKGIEFNTDKAKSKLAECGKSEGFSVDAYVHSLSRIQKRMEAIQGQVAKVGIKLDLKVGDTAATVAAFRDKKGDVMALYEGSYSDPTQYLGIFECNNPGNYVGTCYPQLEKLRDDAEAAYDVAKRKAILQEIAKFTTHSAFFYPVVFIPEDVVMTKKVKGYRIGPQILRPVKWVWMDQ